MLKYFSTNLGTRTKRLTPVVGLCSSLLYILMILEFSRKSQMKVDLKVLSSENLGGPKVVSIDRYCFSVGVLDIFI